MSEQPTEREPMVIELTDGRTTELLFRHGIANTGLVAARAYTTLKRLPFVQISSRKSGQPMIELALEPNPVAAAVQAETERCKAIACRELGGRGELRDRDRLLAALDAKPEPVSEYMHGQADMQKRMINEVRHWKTGPDHSLSPAGFDGMLAGLEKMFILTEPTDAD